MRLALAGPSLARRSSASTSPTPRAAATLAYSGAVALHAGRASQPLPLAVDDAPGLWRIQATDVLTGASDTATIAVAPIAVVP